jgi:hypothetical protein
MSSTIKDLKKTSGVKPRDFLYKKEILPKKTMGRLL